MRLQYLWCIGLQGDLVHSLHVFFTTWKNSCIIAKRCNRLVKSDRVLFLLRGRKVYEGPAQSSWPPVSWLFPREEKPRGGSLLLAVQ